MRLRIKNILIPFVLLFVSVMFLGCAPNTSVIGNNVNETADENIVEKVDNEVQSGETVGEWKDTSNVELTDDLKTLLESAFTGTEIDGYTVTDLIGCQIVAGTNYKVRAKHPSGDTVVLATIYVDLDNTPSLSEFEYETRLVVGDYAIRMNPDFVETAASKGITSMGGFTERSWNYASNKFSLDLIYYSGISADELSKNIVTRCDVNAKGMKGSGFVDERDVEINDGNSLHVISLLQKDSDNVDKTQTSSFVIPSGSSSYELRVNANGDELNNLIDIITPVFEKVSEDE